jgi:sterol carrier protein 2
MPQQNPKSRPAYVLGVGMTKFLKPRGRVDYPELGYEAGIKALLDAKITYADVNAGVACYVYGDSTSGQRVFYQLGMTGIPIWNVNNNCSTGSSGLALARGMVGADWFGGGKMECVMVIGFEKMFPGSLKNFWHDRAGPTDLSRAMMEKAKGKRTPPKAALMFGDAGREYADK